MAKPILATDFKDDIMQESMNGKRRYRMVNNSDGTVSFEDVTDYQQVGNSYGAGQINATNEAVNQSVDANKVVKELSTIAAITKEGYVPDALAVKKLNESLGEDENGMTIHEKLDYIMEMNLNVELSNVKALSQSTVISGLEVGKKYIAFLTNVNGYDVTGFNLNNCVIHQQTSVVISSSNNSRCAFMQGFIFTANSETVNVNILVDGNGGAKDCGIICFEV